jgi:outer membrane protein TolC
LYKWTGREVIGQEMDMSFPKLPALPRQQQLKAGMVSHPAIEAGSSRVNASESEVKLADAKFNAGWKLDLKYGYRQAAPNGMDRADFISAMVMVDMPFFTGKRQGKELQASESMLAASKSSLDDLRRKFQLQLDASLATYQRAGERLELYSSRLLPQAEQNTEATLTAYQSGVTSFNDLVRSRLTELDAHLQYLKLQIDQARAQVRLLYLAGG